MRILFVAIPNSIHVARWISQIADQSWDIHLVASNESARVHKYFKDITIHQILYFKQEIDASVKVKGLPVPGNSWYGRGKRFLNKIDPHYRSHHLKRIIQKIKPDIIHSSEIQKAGYLTADVYQQFDRDTFPLWIVENWGSDIYLYGRLPEHVDRIKYVMASCDYYHCECHRDVALAKEFGFQGEVLPVFPVSGGFDIKWMRSLIQDQKTSDRRLIALKGYQNWAGRALSGLRAIELCADILKEYKIVVYMANDDVILAARLIAQSTGLDFEFESNNWTHEEILRMHGSARISIGLSISDAISTSLLEAMIMGSFPIQSDTGCGDEWITDGENGILVEPNSPEEIASAIRRTIADDEMVNNAAKINMKLAEENLDISIVKPKAIDMYQKIMAQGRVKKN